MNDGLSRVFKSVLCFALPSSAEGPSGSRNPLCGRAAVLRRRALCSQSANRDLPRCLTEEDQPIRRGLPEGNRSPMQPAA